MVADDIVQCAVFPHGNPLAASIIIFCNHSIGQLVVIADENHFQSALQSYGDVMKSDEVIALLANEMVK